MFKTKKVIIGLILSSMLCSSNYLAFGNQNNVTTNPSSNIELGTIVENNGVKIIIYTPEEMEEIMNESYIQPYNIEYIAESVEVTKKPFNRSIELTPEYRYAKAFYSNKGSIPATMIIDGPISNDSVEVPAGGGAKFLWTNYFVYNQTYTVSITNDGSESPSGFFSLGKSNIAGELK